MKRILTLALACLLPVGLAAPASAEDLRGSTVSDTLFGLHVKGVQQGVWPSIEFGTLRLWDNDTTWAAIEKSPGVFDWTTLDTAVATAQKNGVTDILMVLSGTPAWASTSTCQPPACLPSPGAAGMPRDLALWDNWVTQVVTRYKGRITSYQPWNEANLQTFFEGTPAQMADITARTYRIVKSIDPSATVVAPSTGTRLGAAFKRFYPPFLKELGERNWPVDVWAVHSYPASLGTPRERSALAAGFIQTLRDAGAPEKPIWDTENNYGLKGPGPANPDVDIEGKRAEDWTAVSFLDSLQLGISRMYMYVWEPPNDLWGIQFYNGTVGARAMQTMQDWIVGAVYTGCTQQGARVTCRFTKDGEQRWIVYSTQGKKKFALPPRFDQVCKLDGTCKPIRKDRVRTYSPVLVTP
jgi:hypothetical protein